MLFRSGQPAPADLLAWYRRPVDLPVLQPVTPEAMAELEADEMVTVVCVSQDTAKTMTWLPARKEWQSSAGADNPLEWQWFVNLSTIPEAQADTPPDATPWQQSDGWEGRQ